MNTPYIVILVWNVIVLILYGVDKLRARAGARRIRELTLIAAAFLMGGAGALFGMVLFNHKTSKLKFRTLIPLSIAVNIAVAYAVL